MSYHTICEYFPNTRPLICTGGKVPNACKTFFGKCEIPKLCISLSGGVDSMVVSWTLKQLLKDTELHALHINYNNRETSTNEAEFVRWWCDTIGISMTLVNIDIKREEYMHHDRNYYERRTHKIRFDGYAAQNCPVILAHNYDDCIENVITNIASQRSLDNLKGMSMISNVSDVVLYRPLLDVAKKDIINYARRAYVPYLQDSTPSWSRRGKLRDVLIPTLNKIEPSFIKGLMKLQ
jgi:tRNA(Ile)-lysidine synthetase-like protein